MEGATMERAEEEQTEEGLSTDEVVDATGLSYRQIDNWVRLGVITPELSEANGSGTRRRWSFDQVRVLLMMRELRRYGASTMTLRAAAGNLAAMEEMEGRSVWGTSILVTEDGRILRPITCDEHGWIIRLHRCRDLATDVKRLASFARAS